MPNANNIIPNSERTPEERREIAAAGGRASGAARRRKKSLREAADLFLSLPVSDTKTRKAMSKAGVASEDIDNQMMIIVGLAKKAAKGDAKAAALLFNLFSDESDDSKNAEQAQEHNSLIEAIKGMDNED